MFFHIESAVDLRTLLASKIAENPNSLVSILNSHLLAQDNFTQSVLNEYPSHQDIKDISSNTRQKFIVVDIQRYLTDQLERILAAHFNSFPEGSTYLFRLLLPDAEIASTTDLFGKFNQAYPDLVFRAARGEWILQKEQWIRVDRRKPTVFLFIGDSLSGKTSAAQLLGKRGAISVIHGDKLLYEIAMSHVSASEELFAIAEIGISTKDWSDSIAQIFERNYQTEFIDDVVKISGWQDFIFDLYIPEFYRKDLIKLFQERNFFTVCCST